MASHMLAEHETSFQPGLQDKALSKCTDLQSENVGTRQDEDSIEEGVSGVLPRIRRQFKRAEQRHWPGSDNTLNHAA